MSLMPRAFLRVHVNKATRKVITLKPAKVVSHYKGDVLASFAVHLSVNVQLCGVVSKPVHCWSECICTRPRTSL